MAPPRAPKGGVVRLGEKVENANGREYPRELDYFNVEDAPAIKAIYGDKPKMIRGMFASNDIRQVIDLGYKKWHQNNTIACQGDGQIAIDLDEGKEVECLGEDCPAVKEGKCHRQCTVAFIPTEAPTIAVHTFTSGGWRTSNNVMAFADLLMAVRGHLAGIPWVMIREPYKCKRTMPDGKVVNQVHHTVRFDLEQSLNDLVAQALPAYERPAAFDQADPAFYPKSIRATEAPALPPVPEPVETEIPKGPVIEAPLAAVPEDSELAEIYKGFDACGIDDPAERQKLLAEYDGRFPDLDRYLVNLFEGWLPPTTPKPVKATRTSPIEEPVVEAPKAAKKPRGAMF